MKQLSVQLINKLISTSCRANESYSRSSFTKLSNLNFSAKNKKQRYQIQFSLERLNTKNGFITCHITPVKRLCFEIFDSSILQEMFTSDLKCLLCDREKIGMEIRFKE